jgi:hypothetical protein
MFSAAIDKCQERAAYVHRSTSVSALGGNLCARGPLFLRPRSLPLLALISLAPAGLYALGAAAARTPGFDSAHRPTNIPACCVLSRRRLEIENLFLRHQLNIALRRAPHRLRLRANDRALLVWMTWLWPSLLGCPASFSLTRSCGGIERGFGPIGAGNLGDRPGRP